jgi:hypothetical protein
MGGEKSGVNAEIVSRQFSVDPRGDSIASAFPRGASLSSTGMTTTVNGVPELVVVPQGYWNRF